MSSWHDWNATSEQDMPPVHSREPWLTREEKENIGQYVMHLVLSYASMRAVRSGFEAIGMKPITAKKVAQIIGPMAYLVGASYSVGRFYGDRVVRLTWREPTRRTRSARPRSPFGA